MSPTDSSPPTGDNPMLIGDWMPDEDWLREAVGSSIDALDADDVLLSPGGDAPAGAKPKTGVRKRRHKKAKGWRHRTKVVLGGFTTAPEQLNFLAYGRLESPIGRVSKFQELLNLSNDEYASFKAHAREAYLSDFRKLFTGSDYITCSGDYDGCPCPNSVSIPTSEPTQLSRLALDHEAEFRLIMDRWGKARKQLTSPPTSWTDGINPSALCHMLFGVTSHPEYGEPFLRFRCKKCHIGMPHGRAFLPFVLPHVAD